MRKILFIFCSMFLTILPVFAQSNQTEALTITAYYPSPYGSYGHLQTRRLAIGDRNNDGMLTDSDQPPNDGQLYMGRSVIYAPLNPLPTVGTPGELAYNASAGAFYYYAASGAWVPLGGNAPGMYITYNGSCFAGYTNKGSLGTWGQCETSGPPVTDGFFRPPGGACMEGNLPGIWYPKDYNETFVCSGSGGGCYVSYNGSCLAGFTNKGSLGTWGSCCADFAKGDPVYCRASHLHRPPGARCPAGWPSYNMGTAVACCQ